MKKIEKWVKGWGCGWIQIIQAGLEKTQLTMLKFNIKRCSNQVSHKW